MKTMLSAKGPNFALALKRSWLCWTTAVASSAGCPAFRRAMFSWNAASFVPAEEGSTEFSSSHPADVNRMASWELGASEPLEIMNPSLAARVAAPGARCLRPRPERG